MLLVFTRILLVCYSYITRVLSHITGMCSYLLVCIRMLLVCTRMYLYVTRMYPYDVLVTIALESVKPSLIKPNGQAREIPLNPVD